MGVPRRHPQRWSRALLRRLASCKFGGYLETIERSLSHGLADEWNDQTICTIFINVSADRSRKARAVWIIVCEPMIACMFSSM
jgi:hypothetical protein